MSSQQKAETGDYSYLIQIIGNSNVVGIAPHLTIRCPSQKRRTTTEPAQDEAALLRPGVEATEFVGRTDLIKDFVSWAQKHDSLHPVSVRVVHGGAGTGKTRFARELCRALGPDWQAGFVDSREARRFLCQNNLSSWSWQSPSLVVFDYALSLVDVLSDWTRELCHITQRPHPLRILLLERQAKEQSGWLEQAFPGGFGFDATGPQDLLDGKPMLLPGLNTSHIQRGIMQNMLDHLGSKVTLPPDDAAFHDRLAATDWAGAPLYLMMAAMVMHQQGGVGDVLHLGRVDLAHFVATHEYSRLNQACSSFPSLTDFLPHMAAFATLCGGVDGLTVMDCVRREKGAVGCENINTLAAVQLLSSLLPDEGEGIAPIRPDIVGEAFLLDRLAGGRQSDGRQAVSRAFGDRPSEVAAVLVRCVQDFVPRPGRGSTKQAEKLQKRAIEWLNKLGDIPKLPLRQLLLLIDELPANSASLCFLSLGLQQQATDMLRSIANTEDSLALLAMSLNNLSIRLSNLHNFDLSIKASVEAVEIIRTLSEMNRPKHIKNLALKLTTHASSLSKSGRHNDAIPYIEEAVKIRRELSTANQATNLYDYAMSLNAYAIILGNCNHPEEALVASTEALDVSRKLHALDRDRYKSILASCLITISIRYAENHKYSQSIAHNIEALTHFYELAYTNPDEYQPILVDNYNNLSLRFIAIGNKTDAIRASRSAAISSLTLLNINPEIYSKKSFALTAKWLSLVKDIPIEEAATFILQDHNSYIQALLRGSDLPSSNSHTTDKGAS